MSNNFKMALQKLALLLKCSCYLVMQERLGVARDKSQAYVFVLVD